MAYFFPEYSSLLNKQFRVELLILTIPCSSTHWLKLIFNIKISNQKLRLRLKVKVYSLGLKSWFRIYKKVENPR